MTLAHPLSDKELDSLFSDYVENGIEEWSHQEVEEFYNDAVERALVLLYETNPEHVDLLLDGIERDLRSDIWHQRVEGGMSGQHSDGFDTYEFNMKPFKVILKAHDRQFP